MGWSNGKTMLRCDAWEKSKLVHIEKTKRKGRCILVVRPYDWYEFFSTEDLLFPLHSPHLPTAPRNILYGLQIT